MFVAGLETDLVQMRRVGKVAFWSAFGGVILPLVGGAADGGRLRHAALLGRHLRRHDSHRDQRQHLGADTNEIGALRTREGSTILGAAVIDDVMGIVVLSVVVALAKASGGGVDLDAIGIVVVRMAACSSSRPMRRGRASLPVLRLGGAARRQPGGPARGRRH